MKLLPPTVRFRPRSPISRLLASLRLNRSGREVLNAIRTEGIERIRERTQAYAAAVSRWPEDERKYVPDPVRWFKRGNYDDDPKTWLSKGAPRSEYADAF